MRICVLHWDALKKAIADRGMAHLGVKTGQEAAAQAVNDIEGRGAENVYDPLMSSNYMIWENALRAGGLAMMNGDMCPICQLNVPDWIDKAADAALAYAKEQGLV